jgi:hypothetical protein
MAKKKPTPESVITELKKSAAGFTDDECEEMVTLFLDDEQLGRYVLKELQRLRRLAEHAIAQNAKRGPVKKYSPEIIHTVLMGRIYRGKKRKSWGQLSTETGLSQQTVRNLFASILKGQRRRRLTAAIQFVDPSSRVLRQT